MERDGDEPTKQQVDAIAAAGGSSAMLLWPSTIGAALGSVVMMCVLALYFLLAGKVTGLAVAFKQGLALAGWSSMPGILASLLGLYGTLSMTPQTFIDALRVSMPAALIGRRARQQGEKRAGRRR